GGGGERFLVRGRRDGLRPGLKKAMLPQRRGRHPPLPPPPLRPGEAHSMAVRIEPDAEPLPGYRLIERLGGGGFGEVWKCRAPGGLHKAIKFVFGDLSAAGDGQRAEQELKAMSRVKTVRHPYILSLERYDIIDGQLMIVMELADRNL